MNKLRKNVGRGDMGVLGKRGVQDSVVEGVINLILASSFL